ncbi:MAG: glycosyltransferase family 39 protein [Pirellulales bacterium]|nr:glycosyltransferase family 39 protein [Pirellulales bacterium]
MSDVETAIDQESAPGVPPVAASPPRVVRWLPWLMVALALAFVVPLRIKFLDVPLDRDEGEFAYGGQLILGGDLPYRSLYAMKMPGIYVVYAASEALFGQTCAGVHLGHLIVNALTILMLFALAARLFDPMVGATAATAFALFSLSPSVDPLAAQSENFVVLPVLAGIYVLLLGLQHPRWYAFFLGGVLIGLGPVIKQHGSVFALGAGGWLVLDQLLLTRRAWGSWLAHCGWFAVGLATPMAIVFATMYALGNYDDFVFWTLTYAREYVTMLPRAAIERNVRAYVPYQWKFASMGLLWLLAGAGLLVAPLLPDSRRRLVLLVPWTIASLVGVSLGFYFRTHYFLLLIPVAAVLIGITLRFVARLLTDNTHVEWQLTAQLALAAFVFPVGQLGYYYWPQTDAQLSRHTYFRNPFVESLPIAAKIARYTSPQDKVAILASEPQILFYSQRRSATGHIYMYPLMEPHPYALQMQEQVIADIEKARPKFVVFSNQNVTWVPVAGSHQRIFQWWGEYAENYEIFGTVDMQYQVPLIRWADEGAVLRMNMNREGLTIYRRRPNAP